MIQLLRKARRTPVIPVSTSSNSKTLRTALLLAVAGFGAALTLLFLGGEPSTVLEARPVVSAMTGHLNDDEDIDLPPRDTQSQADSSSSKTTFSLVLVASKPGRHPGEGTVALGVDPRKPQIYGIGSLLENGARVAEIYPDHVVLQRGTERVSLYVKGGLTTHGIGAFERHDSSLVREGLTEVRRAAVARDFAVLPEGEVEQTLLAQPYFANGELAGFQVSPGKRVQAFERLGLLSGDVIVSVEGAPVRSELQWRAIAAPLAARKSVNVTVTRGDTLWHLSLDGSIFKKQTTTR